MTSGHDVLKVEMCDFHLNFKIAGHQGAGLAQSEKHATLDLDVMGWRHTMGTEITKKKKERKKRRRRK